MHEGKIIDRPGMQFSLWNYRNVFFISFTRLSILLLSLAARPGGGGGLLNFNAPHLRVRIRPQNNSAGLAYEKKNCFGLEFHVFCEDQFR